MADNQDQTLIEKLCKVLNLSTNPASGLSYKTVEIKGTTFLMPELPSEDDQVKELDAMLDRRLADFSQ